MSGTRRRDNAPAGCRRATSLEIVYCYIGLDCMPEAESGFRKNWEVELVGEN